MWCTHTLLEVTFHLDHLLLLPTSNNTRATNSTNHFESGRTTDFLEFTGWLLKSASLNTLLRLLLPLGVCPLLPDDID